MVKAITILDAIYQAQKSESNRKQSDDFAEYDDEYYIDPDIFDDETLRLAGIRYIPWYLLIYLNVRSICTIIKTLHFIFSSNV